MCRQPCESTIGLRNRGVIEGLENERRKCRVGGKQLRKFLIPQIRAHCAKDGRTKPVVSQFLGVICFGTAISHKTGCAQTLCSAVSRGVERYFMHFSSCWLIDFAPGRKSHVHLVCGLASGHAKMPLVLDRARMKRAPKNMQKSISTCILLLCGFSCGAWGA